MGVKPGIDGGYALAPAAIVNGKPTPGKPHHNHAFYGPGYPTAHPGLFPQNPRNAEFSASSWLKFDYRAGWGTDEFEDKVLKKRAKVDISPQSGRTWTIAKRAGASSRKT